MSPRDQALSALGRLALAVVLLMPLRALALGYGWAVVVVPLGAPPVGYIHALGLAWLMSLATPRHSGKGDDDEAHQWAVFVAAVLSCAFAAAGFWVIGRLL